jgi:integrase
MVTLDAYTTKNDEPRQFPYKRIAELSDAITTQLASAEKIGRDTDRVVSHLFHEADGTAITEYHFYEAWRAATIAAGCPGRIPHDFRRTAVRNLVRAGVPDPVAMQLTGHKTRSVFDRYDITSGADLTDAGAKLDAFLSAPAPAATTKATGTIRQFARAAGRRQRRG